MLVNIKLVLIIIDILNNNNTLYLIHISLKVYIKSYNLINILNIRLIIIGEEYTISNFLKYITKYIYINILLLYKYIIFI